VTQKDTGDTQHLPNALMKRLALFHIPEVLGSSFGPETDNLEDLRGFLRFIQTNSGSIH